jgi:GT2 family glycosyltransferase
LRVDLVLWEEAGHSPPERWPLGEQHRVPFAPAGAHGQIAGWLASGAEYLLFWDPRFAIPDPQLVLDLADSGDITHAGLYVGTRGLPHELDYVHGEWSLLDPDQMTRGTSWRVSLRCCLASTAVLRTLGQIDPAFESMDMAGLEAGLRWLRRGAIVWHDPRLLLPGASAPPLSTPLRDRYLFLYRTYKEQWARYVCFRRCLTATGAFRELTAFREARAAAAVPAPARATWERPGYDTRGTEAFTVRISVVIPTLGRYPYLPQALESLRQQSIRPLEVICVDQNPVDQRRPDLYEPFRDLDLKVIWQEERGQSLARNTGLAETSGDYVFLFDDDSIAAPDALEQHLRALLHYNADVSTGVSFPPPPQRYELPEAFSFLRVAQTFDSGNALLTRGALQAVGGFDRAYDHGVWTDTDLGTRLYLGGALILHNPRARRVHYKAPSGGLRTYGAWWAQSTVGLLRPFPAPTHLYYQQRFLTPRQRRERLLLLAATGLLPRQMRQTQSIAGRGLAAARAAGLLSLLPLRIARARAEAELLLAAGPKIPEGQPLLLSSQRSLASGHYTVHTVRGDVPR